MTDNKKTLIEKDNIVFAGKAITLFSILLGLPCLIQLVFLNGWFEINFIFLFVIFFGILAYLVGITAAKGWWY